MGRLLRRQWLVACALLQMVAEAHLLVAGAIVSAAGWSDDPRLRIIRRQRLVGLSKWNHAILHGSLVLGIDLQEIFAGLNTDMLLPIFGVLLSIPIIPIGGNRFL